MAMLWRSCRLGRCRSGSAAVEFGLVLPVLLLFVLSALQGSLLLFTQNNMVSATNEVARRLAVGEITESQAKQIAAERLPSWVGEPGITVSQTGGSGAGAIVRVTMTVPMKRAAIVDPLGYLAGSDLAAGTSVRIE